VVEGGERGCVVLFLVVFFYSWLVVVVGVFLFVLVVFWLWFVWVGGVGCRL